MAHDLPLIKTFLPNKSLSNKVKLPKWQDLKKTFPPLQSPLCQHTAASKAGALGLVRQTEQPNPHVCQTEQPNPHVISRYSLPFLLVCVCFDISEPLFSVLIGYKRCGK